MMVLVFFGKEKHARVVGAKAKSPSVAQAEK